MSVYADNIYCALLQDYCLLQFHKSSFLILRRLYKYLKFIKVKTLIVWGENDRETKMYMARKFRKLISDSRLVVFKNCGHFSFLENKEDFVIVLDTFLKNL